MEEAMFTYINEEYETNRGILKNRKENLKSFIDLAKGKKYNGWTVSSYWIFCKCNRMCKIDYVENIKY